MPRAGVVHAPLVCDRREKLAINLFDLEHVHPTIRGIALAGKLDVSSPPIWVDRSRLDETAVPFICSLLDAAAVCDVLRAEARRHNDPPIRVYIKKETAWTRLPHLADLTVIENGKPGLSPEWFPRAVELVPYRPMERKPIF